MTKKISNNDNINKKLKEIKIIKNIFFCLFFLSIIGVSYSVYKILEWKKHSIETINQIDDIQHEVVVDEVVDNEKTEENRKRQNKL